MSKTQTSVPTIRASRSSSRSRPSVITGKRRGPDIVIAASSSIYSRSKAKPSPRPRQTVEQFQAQGGKIERLPAAWDVR